MVAVRPRRDPVGCPAVVMRVVEFVHWLVVAIGENGCFGVVVIHDRPSVFLRLFRLIQHLVKLFGYGREVGLLLERARASFAMSTAARIGGRAWRSCQKCAGESRAGEHTV